MCNIAAGNFQNRKLAELQPTSLVLEGETPRLIDEWQEVSPLRNAVRIMNPIQTASEGIRTKNYNGGNDLSIYTYLKKVRYQVRAHFIRNDNRPELYYDYNENKHHNIAKRMIERGGRRDVFLGTHECHGDVSPCVFDEAEDKAFDEAEESTETGYLTANEFNMALDGYSKRLDNTSQMYVLALDSATPGRLALTYFKELSASRYLNSIRSWQESCRWRQEYSNKEKKLCRYEGIASIKEIAEAVYGTEQNKRLTLRSNSDRKKVLMLIATFDRLRPCIIDGAAIPSDIVKTAVIKASNPTAYEKPLNYLRVLHIACSLVKKYYWGKGVKFDMKLDEKYTDRSYLYGRLLAVAEKVERSTFERSETRSTNAERYMPQFSRTPMRTWEIIRKNTQIYLNQLKPGSREYYKNLYSAISALFEEGAFESKSTLDGRYLLGYDCQREALKYRKKDNINMNNGTEKTDNDNEEEN